MFLPARENAHYYVVISDANAAGEVVVVNWTTLKDDSADEACFLDEGDHPCIGHKSTVAYSRAHLWSANKIIPAVEKGELKEVAPLEASVLEKVVDGARASPQLSPDKKELL